LFDLVLFYNSRNTDSGGLALVTFPWVPIEVVPWGFAEAQGRWAAPSMGAPLARQGRFASLVDGLRPLLTREPPAHTVTEPA